MGTYPSDNLARLADALIPPVRVLRMPWAVDLPLPAKATPGSAGLDLMAAYEVLLPPGSRSLVKTGFAFAIPAGFEGQIRPRSGLALKHGVTVLNSPGTIDSDYRGEVGVILINHSTSRVAIRRGDRVAQMVIAPVASVEVLEVADLDETERVGGFGSSGR